ncbi:MAG: serine hydrolase [Parachlamydiaceae bacterium]
MLKILTYCIFLLKFGSLFSEVNIEEFDRWIEQERIKSKVPGLGVAVVKGNQVLLLKGYGVSSVDGDAKVDENTHFQLASVSKTFTAATIAVLVDKELLQWDKPISEVYPNMVLNDYYATRYATAKDLLAHRSGLPAFKGDLLGQSGYSPAKIVQRIRYMEPETSFREKALYSNVGFFLAGEVAGSLLKMPWVDVCKEKLLIPLDMSRSGFYPLMEEKNSSACHAKVEGKIQHISCDPSLTFAAAGGIVSTASDMAHWLQMLLNKGIYNGQKILSPESVQKLFTPAMISEVGFTESAPIQAQSGFSYSLGFNVYHYLNEKIVEKGGALDGIRTVITLIPEKNLGIVVLANLNLTLLPERIRAKFLELFVGPSGQDITKALDEQEKAIDTVFQKPEKPKGILPMNRPLVSYAGLYQNSLYGKFSLETSGDLLKLFAGPGGYPGTLEPFGNDTFILSWPSINAGTQTITFTFDPEGNPLFFTTETLGTFKTVR